MKNIFVLGLLAGFITTTSWAEDAPLQKINRSAPTTQKTSSADSPDLNPKNDTSEDPGQFLEEAPPLKMHSPVALYGSLIGDPGINSIGINLAYQFADDWRVFVGVGTAPTAWTSIGGGINYFIPTGCRFRPFVGMGLTDLMLNVDFTIGSSNWSFGSISTYMANAKVGVEYQAPTGFFVGLHWSEFYAFQGNLKDNSAFAFIPVPALSIGSFF